MMFTLGFLCASLLWLSAGAWYYLRLRKRVATLKRSLHYNKASQVVGEALDRIEAGQRN
jgi:hypothetical protein